jgi:hypothetical protein
MWSDGLIITLTIKPLLNQPGQKNLGSDHIHDVMSCGCSMTGALIVTVLDGAGRNVKVSNWGVD